MALRGRAKFFGGEWVVRSARNAWRSLRACVWAAWGSGSAWEGRVAVRGRATAFSGEWVVRSVGVHRRCVGSGSVREGGEKMLGKGASLCGGGRRSSAGNGLISYS